MRELLFIDNAQAPQRDLGHQPAPGVVERHSQSTGAIL
jgi:hypothetical protein